MSQIGPDYTYNTDSTIPAATSRKLATLARKDPQQAAVVAQLIGYGDSVPGINLTQDPEQALQGFDKYTRNQIQTLFAQELAISAQVETESRSLRELAQSGAAEISEFGETISDGIDTISRDFNELMKPVSTSIGSTLGSLTGMLKDPLGSISLLPQTLADVVSKVNPEFAARMEATFKSEKIKNLTNLPGQIMGSIQNLITEVDKLLAVPISLISDLYFGLMEIMDAIGELVDTVLTAIQNFFFGPGGLLDSILPISDILLFLDALSEFAAEIQGITTIFLGANPIAGFTLSLQNYTNQLGSFLSNPSDLLFAYLPPEVNQGLYNLRNPQQFINNILPPELSQLTAKISQITGFGFNGNMGFGLQSVLEGLQGGVLNSILSNFANQYSILTPLLGNGNINTLNSSQPPVVGSSPVNPAVAVPKEGIPQPQTPPEPPIPETTGPSGRPRADNVANIA